VDVTVADEDLALLQSLGDGDASAGLMAMLPIAVDALPADLRAALEAQVHPEADAPDDTDDAADR
jgi:hypothetical protein